MPYKLTYLEDEHIILTEYTTPVSQADLGECIQANLAMAAEKGTLLFLGDARDLPSDGSLIDVYRLAELLDSSGVDRRMREAMVIRADPESERMFEFFVTVTSNRGLVVRVFGDIDEARQWLLDEGKLAAAAAAE
jgi:hypothetical protein